MKICKTCLLPEGPKRVFDKGRRECNPCRARRYYTANSEKVKAGVRKWSAENREYRRQYEKEYRMNNPEKILDGNLRGRYGLTLEDYSKMIESQNGVCAICGEKPQKRFHVDHCHETEKVRGLLCMTCNVGLGMFKNDERKLHGAISYLAAA